MITVREEMLPIKPRDYVKRCIQRLLDFNRKDHPDRWWICRHRIIVHLIMFFNMTKFGIFYFAGLKPNQRVELIDTVFLLKLKSIFNILFILNGLASLIIYEKLFFRMNHKLQEIFVRIMIVKDLRLFVKRTYRNKPVFLYIELILERIIQVIQFTVLFEGNLGYVS